MTVVPTALEVVTDVAGEELPTTAKWDPLARQVAAPDTLFAPDISSLSALNVAGAFLENTSGSQNTQAQSVSAAEFGIDDFGDPAIRMGGGDGKGRVIYAQMDGLIGHDEFTVEWRAMHPTLDWSNAGVTGTMFYLRNSCVQIPFRVQSGELKSATIIHPSAETNHVNKTLTKSLTGKGLIAGSWFNCALTLKSGILKFYVNGVVIGELTGVSTLPYPMHSSPESLGVWWCGQTASPVAPSPFWQTAPKIHRTCRVPSTEISLRTLRGDATIDTTGVVGSVSDRFIGSLHPPKNWETADPQFLKDMTSEIRTGKWSSATPIKEGAPDGSHPYEGNSGLFSYDMSSVDVTADYLATLAPEVAIDFGFGSVPQILGGSAAPLAPGSFILKNTYNDAIPTSFSKFATICADMAYYLLVDRANDIGIECFEIQNEPDGVWKGTKTELLELSQQIIEKVRKVDPLDLPFTGPHVANGLTSRAWVKEYMEWQQEHGRAGEPVTWHQYNGDVSATPAMRQIIEDYCTTLGIAVPPLRLSEWNWAAGFGYLKHVGHPFYATPYLCYAYGASFHASNIIALLECDVEAFILAKTQLGSFSEGYEGSLQIYGPEAERWASYNNLVGWKKAVGDEKLDVTADLPPGVMMYAGRDSKTDRIGIVVASTGWANKATRKVDVDLTGLTGEFVRRRYLISPSHSSRLDMNGGEGPPDYPLELMASATLQDDELAMTLNVPPLSVTFVTLDPV